VSTLSTTRRRVQRVGLAGLAAAVLSVGIASPAGAATDVVFPLGDSPIGVTGFPLENHGVLDLMGAGTFTPVPVEYGDTLTVRLPAQLVGTGAEVVLDLDTDEGGAPEVSYTSGATLGDPDHLAVTGLGTDTLAITLPADDGTNGPTAHLTIDPGVTTLGPEFRTYPFEYTLEIDSIALAPVTLAPPLMADSYLPCIDPSCNATVTEGSTITFQLPAGSLLRQVGVDDLTGFEVILQAVDGTDGPIGAPVEPTVQVSADGQSATVVVPAGTPAGSHFLYAAQPTTLGASYVMGQLTVAAAAPAPVAAPTAAPSTQAVVGNAGLRSNTGVHAAPVQESSTGVVAAGAGLLLLAGAGGVAVARSRRRPAVEAGTGEA
jgi:hypothetical protein